MGVEQNGHAIRRRLGHRDGKSTGDRQAVHTLLNARDSELVGFASFVLCARVSD
jgi:hypothetical protein